MDIDFPDEPFRAVAHPKLDYFLFIYIITCFLTAFWRVKKNKAPKNTVLYFCLWMDARLKETPSLVSSYGDFLLSKTRAMAFLFILYTFWGKCQSQLIVQFFDIEPFRGIIYFR